MSEIESRGYFNSSVLVSTEWVANNLDKIRLIESNEDPLLYKSGHIPTAHEVDWVRDLNDPIVRDYIGDTAFNNLANQLGIAPETTVVFYGDKNNWWATYAFWVFQLYGHTNCKIMDGGRLKWEKEGRPLTRDITKIDQSKYPLKTRNDNTDRVFRDGVLEHIKANKKLIDVRSKPEYTGEKLHMDGYPNEGALRGGHIPGAKSVPWAQAINTDDGTFKDTKELKEIYEQFAGLEQKDDVVVYCRIGERSSHTWFVLKYLLGYSQVRNYDGSWTEWGNLVGVPVEK